MSSKPASAITSASPSFWQVIPTAPAFELQARELGQLVRLDVRPQRNPVLVAVGLHPEDVPLDRVEIAGQHGRLELGEPHQPLACADSTPSRTAAVARAA